MSISHYRDLLVWQEARKLTTAIYRITRTFPREEVFGLTQQMRRAALSVVCNIAEGHGRRTRNDTLHFLAISRGSLQELETQVIISVDLEYLDASAAEPLFEQISKVFRRLNGFIRHYETRAG